MPERLFASPRASFRMTGRPHDGEGEGEGGDDDDPPANDNPPGDGNAEALSEVVGMLRDQMEDGGEALNINPMLDRLEQAQQQIQQLRSQVPGDDAVVLEGEEAEQYRRYQELGDPDELESKVEERDQLQQRLRKQERRNVLNEAAEAYGWDPEALRDIAESKDLNVRFGEEDEEPVVVQEDEDGETTEELSSYVDEHISWAQRALNAQDGGNGKAYPSQSGSDEDEPGEDESAASTVLKDRYGDGDED